MTAGHPIILFPNDLTPQVAGHIRYMYPSSIALPDELREAYLPSLLHLLYEFEQTAVIGPVARNDIGCTAEEMMAVLRPTDERIELLTSVATADHDGLSPRFAYGVKELLHQYVQQVVCTRWRAVVNALTPRRSAGGEFGYGKI